MSTQNTTQNTLTDRLASTATIAIVKDDKIEDDPGSWIKPTVTAIQQHLAVELIALEQLARRPLSLQDAVKFILQGVYSPPPPPPTLAQAREADLDTPAGRYVVRAFLATLGEGGQQ